MEWNCIFLVCSFSMLLVLEPIVRGSDLSRPGKEGFLFFFWDTVEILVQIVLLLLIYILAIELWVPVSYQKEWVVLFFLPAAYFLSCVRKKPRAFFLTVFAGCAGIIMSGIGSCILCRFGKALFFVGLLFLFRVLMAGVRWRMFFFRTPKPVSGIPVLCVVAAIIALILIGFI